MVLRFRERERVVSSAALRKVCDVFGRHEDRGWLLNALGKIRAQVEKVQQVSLGQGRDEQVFESELQKLFALFEAQTLNHLGDSQE